MRSAALHVYEWKHSYQTSAGVTGLVRSCKRLAVAIDTIIIIAAVTH